MAKSGRQAQSTGRGIAKEKADNGNNITSWNTGMGNSGNLDLPLDPHQTDKRGLSLSGGLGWGQQNRNIRQGLSTSMWLRTCGRGALQGHSHRKVFSAAAYNPQRQGGAAFQCPVLVSAGWPLPTAQQCKEESSVQSIYHPPLTWGQAESRHRPLCRADLTAGRSHWSHEGVFCTWQTLHINGMANLHICTIKACFGSFVEW